MVYLYHLSKLFCNNAINYPFGNSNHTTYQNWWWLGDGLWHCFNHIIGPNYGNLELRQWQVCSKKIHGMLLPMTGLTCGAETEQSPPKNKFAIAIRRSKWGLNRNPGQDSWFLVHFCWQIFVGWHPICWLPTGIFNIWNRQDPSSSMSYLLFWMVMFQFANSWIAGAKPDGAAVSSPKILWSHNHQSGGFKPSMVLWFWIFFVSRRNILATVTAQSYLHLFTTWFLSELQKVRHFF